PAATASRPAISAATVAANGVDFFDPLKPAFPALDHTTALPWLSLIVTSVLLKVALMWATPSASTARLRALARGAAAAGRAGAPLAGVGLGLATLFVLGFLGYQNTMRPAGDPSGPLPGSARGQPHPRAPRAG